MKIKHVVIVVIALFIGAVFLGRCTTKPERTSLNEAISALSGKISSDSVEINGLNRVVYQKEQIILTERQAKEAGLIENKRLRALGIKRLDQIAVLEADLIVSKNNIPLPDTIFVHDTVDLLGIYMKIPWDGTFTDEYLSLYTWIKVNKTWGFNIQSDIDMTVTVGDKKTGFMKREPTVFVDTPNPYVYVNDITYVNIQKKRMPWWQQSLITIGIWEAAKFGVRSIAQ